VPVDPAVTPVTEPPPPVDTPATETAEIQPPDQAPVEDPLQAITTTAATEAVVAAVPETVDAVEPELVQPPPKRPDPPRRTEQRPRTQPRRTAQPAAPDQVAAVPAQPSVASPPPAAASSGQKTADYANMLRGHLAQRIQRVASMVRETTQVVVIVTIELDGTISASEVSRSSGSPTIDREIMRRVDGASPVPPPPTRLTSIQLPFRIDPR
jgi:protein TonB